MRKWTIEELLNERKAFVDALADYGFAAAAIERACSQAEQDLYEKEMSDIRERFS